MASPQYVYFLRPKGMLGPIKIGCSDVPERRLLDLAAWSPFPLELVAVARGTIKVENNIHDCFADAHSHLEWFHPIPRLIDAINKIAAGVPLEEAIDLSSRRGSVRRKWQRTPAFRQYIGLRTRLWQAARRAGTFEFSLYPPDSVEMAFKQARKNGHKLTDEDRSLINAVIADPLQHCQRYYYERAAA